MEHFKASRDNPPTLTRALEYLFDQGYYKVAYRCTMTLDADGKTDTTIKIDPVTDLEQEVAAVMEAIDLDDENERRQAQEMKLGTYLMLLNKENFETIKKYNAFHEVDEFIKNRYLKNNP